jgi:RHS repeat-associated protein
MTYDAFGRMVENNNGVWEFVYPPAGGSLLAAMGGQTLQYGYVPLPTGGNAIYQGSSLNYYTHPDWLGSPRLLSTPSRATWNPGLAYAPFGEEYTVAGAPWIQFTGVSDSFTVEDNQNETGTLDDFMYRRYNPTQGRWISPDPAGLAAVDPGNPQSWNRYAYVVNSPLTQVDPSGLQGMFAGFSGTGLCNIYPTSKPCVMGQLQTEFNTFSGDLTLQQQEAIYLSRLNLTLNTPPPGVWVAAGGDFAGSGCLRQADGDAVWCPKVGSSMFPPTEFTNNGNFPTIGPSQTQSPAPKEGCTKAALWAGAKAAFNDFFTPPGADPIDDVGDALRDENVQRAGVGVLYSAATAARFLVPVADIAADAIPVAGQVLLVIQGGKALWEGGKAYKESIDQCYGDN